MIRITRIIHALTALTATLLLSTAHAQGADDSCTPGRTAQRASASPANRRRTCRDASDARTR